MFLHCWMPGFVLGGQNNAVHPYNNSQHQAAIYLVSAGGFQARGQVTSSGMHRTRHYVEATTTIPFLKPNSVFLTVLLSLFSWSALECFLYLLLCSHETKSPAKVGGVSPTTCPSTCGPDSTINPSADYFFSARLHVYPFISSLSYHWP